MAKNQMAEVDEDALKSMVMGDIQLFRRNSPVENATQTVEATAVVPVTDTVPEHKPVSEKKPDQTVNRPPRKRKDEETEYRERFLVNIPSSSRCQTYINRDIYKRIKNFLPVIASDTSISGYINNILNHHLEQYGDEINHLYDKNYRKPF